MNGWRTHRLVAASAILVGISLVAACGVFPYRTARNDAICDGKESRQNTDKPIRCNVSSKGRDFAVPRANFEFSSNRVTPPFIGLALSGGGSRAANYAMAVMQELEEIGLMQHVTAISSTSGGGLAGAYYALNGDTIDWPLARKKMRTNFLAKWAAAVMNPVNVLSTSFSAEDRSDLMADIFDTELFDHATYGDLGVSGPRRPLFLANASNVGGGRFTFDEATFRDELGSRLDNFPISQAVVASAAFPGAFNSVTLRIFPNETTPEQPASVPIGYRHVIDGGPADNLGIESLLRLAAYHHTQRIIENDARLPGAPLDMRTSACFIFVVDAYPAGILDAKRQQRDPRSVLDHTVDSNIFAAFDTLLKKRRRELLSNVGLGYTSAVVSEVVRVENMVDVAYQRVERVTQFDVPYAAAYLEDPWRMVKPQLNELFLAKEIKTRNADGSRGTPLPIPPLHFRCTAWHLQMGGLLGMPPVLGSDASTRLGDYSKRQDEEASRLFNHRAKLNILLDQVATSWRLTGPKNCRTEFLQDALYASAKISVQEDLGNRLKICDLLEFAGLPVSGKCRAFNGNKSLELPVDIAFVSPNKSGFGYAETSAVECRGN